MKSRLRSASFLLGGIVFEALLVSGAAVSPASSATLIDVNFANGIPAGWVASAGVATTGGAVALDLNRTDDSYLIAPLIHVVPFATYTFSWDAATLYTIDSNGPEGAVRQMGVSMVGLPWASQPYFGPAQALSPGPPVFSNQTFTFSVNAATIQFKIGDITPYPYNLGGISEIKDVVVTGPAATSSSAPEPATLTFLGAGLLAATRMRKRVGTEPPQQAA